MACLVVEQTTRERLCLDASPERMLFPFASLTLHLLPAAHVDQDIHRQALCTVADISAFFNETPPPCLPYIQVKCAKKLNISSALQPRHDTLFWHSLDLWI